MKTAMQELIDKIQYSIDVQSGVSLTETQVNTLKAVMLIAETSLEKEKEQIIDAHFNGMDKLATSLSEFLPIKHTMSVIQEIKNGGDIHEDGEQYFNEKYKNK